MFWLHKAISDPDSFLIMLFTALLFATSMFQGVILIRQDKRLAESLEQTRRTTDLAMESSERQLRAYLSVEFKGSYKKLEIYHHDFEFEGSIHEQIFGGYNCILVNRGATPAYSARFESDIIMFKKGEIEPAKRAIDNLKSFDLSKNHQTIGLIYPGASYEIEASDGKLVKYKDQSLLRKIIHVDKLDQEIDLVLERKEDLSEYNFLSCLRITYFDSFQKERRVMISRIIEELNYPSADDYSYGTFAN